MTFARALKAKTPEDRLAALLDAWRDCRHSRLADLIDRVSAPLVKAAGPVKAKSVPARTEACIALAKKKDAVSLGRVLITEWPGTWQPALPLLQAVCSAPHDPRVAAHFAAQIDATRYDTWTSSNYWHPLFRHLEKQHDLRQLPLLAAQLERAKGEYYARDMRPAEEAIVKAYRKLKEPKLSAAEEKALTELEAPYATARAEKRSTSKGGAELLAAVYANPADHSLRIVYGDWLLQQGDPRGELISLQAAPLTDKSKTRIRTLIKKHWKDWLGPLRDWFREPPAFTLGFPSSAQLDSPNYKQSDLLEKLAERPEWRTIEWIRSWPYFNEFPLAKALAHPNFLSVRRVSDVRDGELASVLELAPPITDLGIGSVPDDMPRVELGRLKQLKTLRVLARNLDAVAHALGAIETLVITYARDLTAAHWKIIEASGATSVELAQYEAGVWLRRDRRGAPFDTLELINSSSLHYLEGALKVVPDTLVRFGGTPFELHPDLVETLRKQLAHFTKLDFATLPHTLEVVPPTAKNVHVKIGLRGGPLLVEAKAQRVWDLFTRRFGIEFTLFDVGSTARELGDDPVERIKTWAKNARTRSMYLRQKGGKAVAPLHKDKVSYATFDLPLADPKEFTAALRELIELAGPESVAVGHERFDDASKIDWAKVARVLKQAADAES